MFQANYKLQAHPTLASFPDRRRNGQATSASANCIRM